MKKFYIRRPEMFDEAAKGKPKGLLKTLLTFLLFYIIASFVEIIIPTAVAFVDGIRLAAQGATDAELSDNLLLNNLPFKIATLFSSIFSIIGAIIYCVFIENRNLSSMGVKKEHAVRNFLIGGLIGVIMFIAVVLVNVLLGGMTFEGFNVNVSFGLIFVFFAGFIINRMSAVFIFNGCLMNGIGGRHNMAAAVLISSAIFTAIYFGNSGMGVIAAVNLMLIMIFGALFMICFDNIWGVCAIHSLWYFMQDSIFGIKVTGIEIQGNTTSLFSVTQTEGKELINGGEFGADGGLGATIVLLVSLTLLIVYMIKTDKAGFAEKTASENT